MAKFTLFSGLPTELRLDIWERTLSDEVYNRLVILFNLRVIPTKKLFSPLLLVKKESRACALKLYKTSYQSMRYLSPSRTIRCTPST